MRNTEETGGGEKKKSPLAFPATARQNGTYAAPHLRASA